MGDITATDYWQLHNETANSTVSLPLHPQRLTYEAAADIKEVSFPTKTNSLLISLGKKVNKLTLTGVLASGGMSGETVHSTYIAPILAMVRLYVKIMMPTGTTRYNGNWILNRFQYEETGGYTTSFKYTMEFIQGVNGSDTSPGIVI